MESCLVLLEIKRFDDLIGPSFQFMTYSNENAVQDNQIEIWDREYVGVWSKRCMYDIAHQLLYNNIQFEPFKVYMLLHFCENSKKTILRQLLHEKHFTFHIYNL